jgi:putative transposase
MSGFKLWFIAGVRSQFDLSANLTIRAIARVSSNRKTAKLKNKPVKDFRPTRTTETPRLLCVG